MYWRYVYTVVCMVYNDYIRVCVMCVYSTAHLPKFYVYMLMCCGSSLNIYQYTCVHIQEKEMADALKQKEASAEADRLSKFAAPLKRLNTQVATPGVYTKVCLIDYYYSYCYSYPYIL